MRAQIKVRAHRTPSKKRVILSAAKDLLFYLSRCYGSHLRFSISFELMATANFLPLWNSLDSVRRVHSDLEFAAIIFFVLLAFFDVLAHRSKNEKGERTFGGIGLWCFGIAVLCEAVAYPYGQRNDTLSEQIIGSLDQKAKTALSNAQSALEVSTTAETKAEAAKGSADAAALASDRANGSADAASRAASTARKEAGTALTQAEEEQNARERIEAAVAWRRLEPTQASNIVSTLAKFSGEKVTLVYNDGDPEAYSFALDIATALHAAQWLAFSPAHAPVSLFTGAARGPDAPAFPPITGITVACGFGEPSLLAAKAVAKELNDLGFNASFGSQQPEWVSYVSIKVESRPLGPQGQAKLDAQSNAKKK